MKRDLYIQYEQLDIIESAHKNIIHTKEVLHQLCKEEKSDINIGFVLGEIHYGLSKYHTELLFLLDEIKNQKL